VSRAGVMPISFTQDRVGVHAKSVAEAALVLDTIRGFDAEDLLTEDALGATNRAPYATAAADQLRGVRLGKLADMFRTGTDFEPTNAAIAKQIALLTGRGAIIVDGLRTGLGLIGMMPTLRLNSFELRTAFDAYLRRRADDKVKTLADLIATGKYLKGGNLELRLQETMRVDVLEHDEEYRRRRDVRLKLRQTLIELMDRERVDALVYPAKALGAPPLGSTDAAGGRDNAISSVAGLPAIVVPPVVDRDGLPVGLELLGRPFSEPTLFRIAIEYERVRGPRVPPKVQ